MIRFTVFVFVSLTFFTAEAELTTTSALDTTRLIGASVILKCQTTNPSERVRWQFSRPGSESMAIIHTGLQVVVQHQAKFSEAFNHRSRESILTIKSVERIDTGVYRCLETNSAKYKIDFTVEIVLELPTVATVHDSAMQLDIETVASTKRVVSNDGQPTHGDSFRTITIAGIVGVLLFCILIVIILAFVVIKLRQTAAVARSVSNSSRSGHRLSSHGHRHKRQHPSNADTDAEETRPEYASDSLTPHTGSSSSIDGHYSEIAESETQVAATTAAEIDEESLPLDNSTLSANAAQYQGLDPVDVVEFSARIPNIYVNLAHRADTAN